MKENIVYIEDDTRLIELVRFILETRGFKVIGADRGEAGLAKIKEIRPAMILLDLMMPDMDGWEVYRRIKADPDIARTKVLIVTARAELIDQRLGLEIAKVDGYLTKPFTPDELIFEVNSILKRP